MKGCEELFGGFQRPRSKRDIERNQGRSIYSVKEKAPVFGYKRAKFLRVLHKSLYLSCYMQ